VSPAERECIELTYFDGLCVQEVAICCGMSIEAVEDRLRRGLEDMLGYLRAHE
jgi:DNA-directed RNA polymerase specialized sigma24 family protein